MEKALLAAGGTAGDGSEHARRKRSAAAAWLGDEQSIVLVCSSDEDNSNDTTRCESVANVSCAQGDYAELEQSGTEEPSEQEMAAYLRRHRALWHMLGGQRSDAVPDTVWNTGADPWEPEARSWEQPEQHWSACEGRPSWDIWQSTVHGADAAAGGGADWNGALWKDAAQSSCEDAAQRFCVWCGKPVPPNLVQAKFCIFCGKPHSGSANSSSSSAAARRKSAVKAVADSKKQIAKGQQTEALAEAGAAADLARIAALWKGSDAEDGCSKQAFGASLFSQPIPEVGKTEAHLTDDKWDSMTASERILALVKTRRDTGSGVPLQVQ